MQIEPSVKLTLDVIKSKCQEEIGLIQECIKLRLHMTNGLTQEERQTNLENPFQLQLVIHDNYDLEMHAYDLGCLETQEELLETINNILEYEI
jgi:hypothetical protein